MNKKQTEILREHLGICIRLWRWIGKNIKAEEYIINAKDRWPEWAWNGGTIPVMDCDCPCCEFVFYVKKNVTCRTCPLEWSNRTNCDSQCLDSE